MGDRTGLTRLDRTNGYDNGRGYMRAKKAKLAQQNEQIREALRTRSNPLRSDLFKGISIYVNGRTHPTADELKRLILLNGGDYHPYYRYQTTKFMIATNLSMARIKTLRPDDRVVRPEWITDSIKVKCLLPYEDYQLTEEATNNDAQLHLIDLASNDSNNEHFRMNPGVSSKNTSSTRTSLNKTTGKSTSTRKNDDSKSKQQLTLDNFVIRGAARSKIHTKS